MATSKDKLCPKCSQDQLINVTTQTEGHPEFLQTAPFYEKILNDRYVCFSCGFTEEWLSPSNLERAKKTFRRS